MYFLPNPMRAVSLNAAPARRTLPTVKGRKQLLTNGTSGNYVSVFFFLELFKIRVLVHNLFVSV